MSWLLSSDCNGQPLLSPAQVRSRFSFAAAGLDLFSVTLSAGITGYLYNKALYNSSGMFTFFSITGFVIGSILVTCMIIQEEYEMKRYRCLSGQVGQVFWMWNITFVIALLIVFATKTTYMFSRATMVISYCTGFTTVLIFRAFLVSYLKHAVCLSAAAAQRVFLVGSEIEMMRFINEGGDWEDGLRLVGASVLREPDTMTDDLVLAAAAARVARPDDVFILLPWVEEYAIDACLDAFKSVPAAVHLGLERSVARYGELRFSRVGAISGLHLVRPPLTRAESMMKRCFDVLVASSLLVCLLPLLVVIGFAIKLESPGPILFRQRRYGFNQEPFSIYKFRSMKVIEDGPHVRQAEKNDSRITRVGNLIRRYNIDELTQLLNVLSGEMSLVGPRPHALSHDQLFVTKVAAYARRHNVKPGITGWAQVNGFRGPILTDAMIEQRIQHDFHYIDHWSIGFDIKIMLQTVFSTKAFKNAF